MEFAIQILFSLCCHFGNELMLEEKKSNISKNYKCFTVYLSKKKCFVLLSSLHLSRSDFFYFDFFFCTKSITILFHTLVLSIVSVVFLCHFLLDSRPKYRSKNAHICVCFQIFSVISRVKNLKKKIEIDNCKTVKNILQQNKKQIKKLKQQ